MLVVEKPSAMVSLAELKAHLRVEDGGEDALLAGWLRAATEAVEQELGQLLIMREVEELGWVRCGAARLTLGPVQGLLAVEARDGAGGWVALDGHALKRGPARVVGAGLVEGDELRLRYRAGLGADWNAVPDMLRQAVVRLAAHFHAHRDSSEAPAMPPAVRQLLAPARVRRLR